ncbi:MAG: N-acetyltransferase [Burkholderiales bacterium]|nr:N-acetyltransferase [Burkholderiales bacterium]
MMDVAVRRATHDDILAVTAIYGYHVTTGLASFELEPPPVGEMLRRYSELTAQGYPYLVAERDGRIVGYAYAGAYRARPAYRFSVENSVYVDPDARRAGIGGTLLRALVAECERMGFRQMVAVIGDSANTASIGLHAACGFAPIGVLPAIGYKFGRWVDSVFMQRPLGEGGATPPAHESPPATGSAKSP